MLVLDMGELNVETEKPPPQAVLTLPVCTVLFICSHRIIIYNNAEFLIFLYIVFGLG